MFKYIIILLTCAFMIAGCHDTDENEYDEFAEDNTLIADESETPLVQVFSPGPDDASDSITGYSDRVTNILFAHGYSDDQYAWDDFVYYINNNTDYDHWNIYRTDVEEKGSIENRGTQLAEYISNLDDVEDNSLIAVGHSMGGLDLRFVVSKGNEFDGEVDNNYYKAARKIHKIFTLASPHGGNMFGGVPKDDGAVSLGIEQMRAFNEDHPYENMHVDGRNIPMLAFRFHCDEKISSNGTGAIEPYGDSDGDGTVALKRQILFGAPFTQTIFHGRHTTKPPNECSTDDVETTLTDTILKGILDNASYWTDVKDIVFYENLNCEGDEKGAFSSKHKNGKVYCDDDEICDNDEFSSLKIYPGIKPDTVVKLYDSSQMSTSDDWTRIHIGNIEFEEPFCINGFEHNTSDREADQGITVVHHHRNGLNGKVSSLNIFASAEENDPLDIVFYENKDCTGNIVGVFKSSKNYDINCKDDDQCKNDEASSALIYPSASKATDIYLYNDPDGDKDKAWAYINLDNFDTIEPYCIQGFERNYTSDTHLEVTYHEQEGSRLRINSGLTGNVSHITIIR